MVVDAGASSGPCSSGIPSGPGAAGLVVVAVAVVALAVEVAADVAGAVGLLLDELLPPQAATNTAAAGRSGARARRQVIATPNGT